MNLNLNLFKIETNHVAPSKGRMLIAEPFLPGSYFNRSIVLLVAHGEKGAVGFILNKKIEYPVNEIMGDFPDFEAHVCIGGPVSTDTLYFLHSLGSLIPGSVHVKDNLYWGGDFDEVKKLISEGLILPNQIRFFLGYSGWDDGQLEDEINENSWLVSEINDEFVMMDRQTKSMWVQAVRDIGGKYSLWEHFPENPSLN
ncbi:YqgE/AlgH family protein [uncultured Sunxiuqinia sp.]|uniref:YqgE/AlgH family protein n=1 Tax=uncultured Sunxiuqinia sp. TaxID=1573825 RepID=UPI002AA77BE7|nr:YqgE/AlgH family protein [uncultured Sunxiuqinia sp.]